MTISKEEVLPAAMVIVISLLLAVVVPATGHNFFILSLLTSALIWSVQAGAVGIYWPAIQVCLISGRCFSGAQLPMW